MRPTTVKSARQIRQEYIDYFVERDHTLVPSAPVVPADDPTLLFTNAGMNQFKDVFLGTGTRGYARAVDTQKCIRVSGKHNDLEEVGHDTYHHTYFEMLGNWSFGDYFKREAIGWAWDLLTNRWGIEKRRLYATVFAGDESDGLPPDEEAAQLWRSVTDIDPSHVLEFGRKDNFWEMADTGPCGPNSEVHIDLTPDCSGGELVNAGDPRVVELWNLVFIQFNRTAAGTLEVLPDKHVDTGMGFERMVAVLQGTENYSTDVFTPLMEHIGKLVGVSYRTAGEEQRVAFRVLADHVRMLSFSIADGALPSNEGRGYVLRRLLRRAARYGRQLEMREPFIHRLVDTVAEMHTAEFPEVAARADYIGEVIKAEEGSFNRTLGRGLEIFSSIVQRVTAADGTAVPGDEAFRLYDTYGFPLDLTRVMAQERGLTVDEPGFEVAMAAQRERARRAGKFTGSTVDAADWMVLNPLDGGQRFVGYEQLEVETTIHKVARTAARERQPAPAGTASGTTTGAASATAARAAAGNGGGDGEAFHVVLVETPFYAEGGGQVGDRGSIEGDGLTLVVEDTQREGDLTICRCRLSAADGTGNGTNSGSGDGTGSNGAGNGAGEGAGSGTAGAAGNRAAGELPLTAGPVRARVDLNRRRPTTANHTATHLLHGALRRVLGDHVHQSGSLVAPDHLRFDFTHFKRIEPEQLTEIERIVNATVRDDYPVEYFTTAFDQARSMGAMALFGEKYGEEVRVVRVGDAARQVSLELCGGCHVFRTGEIGPFLVTSEGSIASGVRRIEAVTGAAAVTVIQAQRAILHQVSGLVGGAPAELQQRADELVRRARQLEQRVKALEAEQSAQQAAALAAEAETVGGVRLIVRVFDDQEPGALKALAEKLRTAAPHTVAFLATTRGGTLGIACAVSDDLAGTGDGSISAAVLVKQAAAKAGGGGGGRPTLATAGAKRVANLDAVLATVRTAVHAASAKRA